MDHLLRLCLNGSFGEWCQIMEAVAFNAEPLHVTIIFYCFYSSLFHQ